MSEEEEGQLTAPPPANDPFFRDVIISLRDDVSYVIGGGIGGVPTTQTIIETTTTACPGSPERVETRTTVTQGGDAVLGPNGEVRSFSAGDKVFTGEVRSLDYRLAGDKQVLHEVNWEFTRP